MHLNALCTTLRGIGIRRDGVASLEREELEKGYSIDMKFRIAVGSCSGNWAMGIWAIGRLRVI